MIMAGFWTIKFRLAGRFTGQACENGCSRGACFPGPGCGHTDTHLRGPRALDEALRAAGAFLPLPVRRLPQSQYNCQ